MSENEEGKKSPGKALPICLKNSAAPCLKYLMTPSLRKKPKEFGESASASAKVFASRFKRRGRKKEI